MASIIKDVPSAINWTGRWLNLQKGEWESADSDYYKTKMANEINNTLKVMEKLLKLLPDDKKTEVNIGMQNFQKAYDDLMKRNKEKLYGHDSDEPP